uniref:TR10B factor n=1 Tax=Accipiter nisus TaxID=211598 RepID=A0A8B9MIZ5_9AVES
SPTTPSCRHLRCRVELSPCQAVRDTQCACKNGTFCSPDHPCEMCQKCRCPKDEVEQAPCTPHSDRQCGPPTGTFSGLTDNLIATIVVVVFVVVVVLALLVWKCCCRRSPGEHRVRGSPGALALAGGGVCMDVGWVGRGTSFWAKRILTQLSVRSFDIFARDVPFKDWKRFGRALELLENDIALAEMNDRYSLEPFFQMLNTWQNRQGMNASVNTLLETLHQINLGGIALPLPTSG